MSRMSELDIVRQEIFTRSSRASRVARVTVSGPPDKYHPGTSGNANRATRVSRATDPWASRLADVKQLMEAGCLSGSSQVVLEAAVHILELLDGRDATESERAAALADGFDLAWEVVYGGLFE